MKRRVLLASDLDGTLIPMDKAISLHSRAGDFKELIEGLSDLNLAYVTGRHLSLALKGIEAGGLPDSRFLVCDVGTSLYLREEGKWVNDTSYQQPFAKSWKGASALQISDILKGVEALRLQESEKQACFKSSYYVAIDADAKRIVEEVRRVLALEGIEANIVHSVDTKDKLGLIDVLPIGVAKDTAVTYLQQLLNIEADELVYAGDSGNDMAVFLSGVSSIVVGNTSCDVKEKIRVEAKERDILEQIYFAEADCVAGVLEGCHYFGICR